MLEKIKQHKSLLIVLLWGSVLILSLNSLFFVERIKQSEDCFAMYNIKITSAVTAQEQVTKGAYDAQNTFTRDLYNILLPAIQNPSTAPATQAQQDADAIAFKTLFQNQFDRLAQLDKEYASIPVPSAPKC